MTPAYGQTDLCRACPGGRLARGEKPSSTKATIVGAVLLALMAIFTFLGGLPWEPKGAVASLEKQVQRENDRFREDVFRRFDRLEQLLQGRR